MGKIIFTNRSVGGSGVSDYNDILNKPQINNVELNGNKSLSDLGIDIPIVPNKLSAFQDDLGMNPIHTHSQYLTEHQDISGKQDVINSTNKLNYSYLSNTPSIPTESTVSGWGFTKNTGTYSKPNGGIPKTDLASGVQSSLNKADTALQSFTESDPIYSADKPNIATKSFVESEVTNLVEVSSNPTVGKIWVSNNTEDYQTIYTKGEVDELFNDIPKVTKTSELENDSGFIDSNGTAANATKWGGKINDFQTDNTTDTWLLVLAGNRVQHRVVSPNILTAPLHNSSNLLATITNRTYTATQDCVLYYHKNHETTDTVAINGITLGSMYGYGYYAQQMFSIFLKKGDVFTSAAGEVTFRVFALS